MKTEWIKWLNDEIIDIEDSNRNPMEEWEKDLMDDEIN